jgi:hypothetical protein
MIYAIDLFLIGKVFLPVVFWIAKHTGWNGFRQARTLYIASAISCLFLQVGTASFSDSSLVPLWFFVLAALMWGGLCFLRWKYTFVAERIAYRNPVGFADRLYIAARIRVTTLIVFVSLDLLTVTFLVLVRPLSLFMCFLLVVRSYTTMHAVALYAEAVPPPPPYKKKQRDRLAFLRPQPAPNPI